MSVTTLESSTNTLRQAPTCNEQPAPSITEESATKNIITSTGTNKTSIKPFETEFSNDEIHEIYNHIMALCEILHLNWLHDEDIEAGTIAHYVRDANKAVVITARDMPEVLDNNHINWEIAGLLHALAYHSKLTAGCPIDNVNIRFNYQWQDDLRRIGTNCCLDVDEELSPCANCPKRAVCQLLTKINNE